MEYFVVIFVLSVQAFVIGMVWYYSYTGMIVTNNGQSLAGNMFSLIFLVTLVNGLLYGMYREALQDDNYINPTRRNRMEYYSNMQQDSNSSRISAFSKTWSEKRDNGGLTDNEVIERKKSIRKIINKQYEI